MYLQYNKTLLLLIPLLQFLFYPKTKSTSFNSLRVDLYQYTGFICSPFLCSRSILIWPVSTFAQQWMSFFLSRRLLSFKLIVDQKPQTTQYISLYSIENQSKTNLRSCLLPGIISILFTNLDKLRTMLLLTWSITFWLLTLLDWSIFNFLPQYPSLIK